MNSQTLTECDERIRSYIDSDGKPYMCVVDGSRDFLFMKKIQKDTTLDNVNLVSQQKETIKGLLKTDI